MNLADQERLRAEVAEDLKSVVVEDLKGLRFLTRNERRLYKKYQEGEQTMVLDLTVEVVSHEVDGSVIKEPPERGGGVPTLKSLGDYCLRQVIGDDQRADKKYKNQQYLLLKRWKNADKIELTDDERTLMIDRAYKILLQVELRGRFIELIEGEAEIGSDNGPREDISAADPKGPDAATAT